MNIKKGLQALRIKLGKWLLDKKTSNPLSDKIEKILFLRQDGKIGDYIVSSFVFRELKKHYPQLFIAVVCAKNQAYLLEKNPYIDQLYLVKKKNILDYIKVGLKLRKKQFDAVIDPTVFLRNRDLLLLRLIQAKNYVGYQKSGYKLFNINIDGEYHFSELYQQSLAALGFIIENTAYDVPYDEISQQQIKAFLQQNQLSDYIAINFFGASRKRTLASENIRVYLDYLSQKSAVPIVLLGYPQVNDLLENIALNYKNVFVYPTQTLFHTIELIRFCRQIISTDTSTVHIASGFNKDMIAFYREDPINIKHWQPKTLGKTQIIFYKQNINELPCECIPKDWLAGITKHSVLQDNEG